MSHRRHLLVAMAALLAAAGADSFDYVRIFPLPSKGSGTWAGKFPPATGEGDLVGLVVAADWWDGPGDGRVGDEKKSAMPGVVFEVKRGEGPWVALPPVDRDLRLTARAEASPETEGLLGGRPAGDWQVRQTAGGGYPRDVRLLFTCRGDPLGVTDLRVKSFALPGRDPEPVVGRPHIPDRTGNPTLKPGDPVEAVVVVENAGARRTKETEVDLVLAPYGKTQGKRIAFAQVPRLKPGETVELKLAGTLPVDEAAQPGNHEIVAVVDPRGAIRETETLNNALGRAFRLEIPVEEDVLPGDLRDR